MLRQLLARFPSVCKVCPAPCSNTSMLRILRTMTRFGGVTLCGFPVVVAFLLLVDRVAPVASRASQATLTFDDNRHPPLDVKETGRREEGRAVLRDISYVMLDEATRNSVTIVEPKAASGRRLAVLFVHWYGPPRPTSNRTEFIPDAVDLAGAG